MAAKTPIQALALILRSLGPTNVPLVTWDDEASPFYQVVPEVAPAFPYVVFDVPPSSLEHQFGSYADGGAYVETLRPTFKVAGLSANVEEASAPWIAGGLCNFLDSFSATPEDLGGQGFACIGWWRLSYVLTGPEDQREDQYKRVWVASAEYEMKINVPYPTRR